jgi:predicted transposase YbfD/YdcC
MTLASVLAPDNNETQAALDVIALVALKGCIVTADALHCHAAMAKAVLDQGADYVLAVKANQPTLLADAKAALAELPEQTLAATTQDTAHGRAESRAALVTSAKAVARKHAFPGLAAVAKITSRRDGQEPVERFFLLSQPYKAEALLAIRRDHWGIENTLHWTLDVVMDEDLARNRKDNGPANLAVLRRLALNIARAHPDKKTSLRRKLLRAGWDETFLFELIRHMR